MLSFKRIDQWIYILSIWKCDGLNFNNSQIIFPVLHKPLYSHLRIRRNILTPCPLRTVQNVSSNSGMLSTLCKHWPSHKQQCGLSTRSSNACWGILRYSIDLLLRVLNWYNLMIQINKKGTSLIIMFQEAFKIL